MARTYTPSGTGTAGGSEGTCAQLPVPGAPNAATRYSVSETGTSGSVAQATISVSNTVVGWSFLTDTGVGLTTWNAGDYVVTLNVLISDMNATWVSTHCCEWTSGGLINSVASLAGQSISLGSTGSKVMTINRATDYATAATSQLLVVIGVNNSSTMSAATPQIGGTGTSILTPFTAAGGGGGNDVVFPFVSMGFFGF